MTVGGRVVQVGDVAGVAGQLARAMASRTDWSVESLPAPELGAGRSLPVKAIATPIRMMDLLTRVSGRVRRSGADVVHVHWARYAPFLRTGSVPLVVHAHGSDVRGWRQGLAPRIMRRSLEAADAVVVSTPDLLVDVPQGAVVLPNPLDCEFWQPERDSAEPTRRPVVLIHARLIPVKGANTLVAAARALLEQRPDVSVVAFGGTELDAAAQHAGIELLAPGTAAVVRDAIRGADLVIGQQRLGALGISELEAMACERPVVMPLERSLYGDAVPVVDGSDSDDIAQVCTALLDDPASRRSIGAAGRRYVLDHHDLPVVAASLAELYEGLR